MQFFSDHRSYALPWLAAALLLGASACCLAAPDSFELIANGGFEALNAEGGAENWAVRNFGQDQTHATSRLVGKAPLGARCLQLEGTSRPIIYGCFSHPVTLPQPTPDELLLTVYYRTVQSPQADLSLTTFAEDFTEKEWATPVLSSENVPLESSPGWRSLSWVVRLLPGARQAIVMVRIHGAGSIFIDGASLRPRPAEVACEVLEAGLVQGPRGPRQCLLNLTNRTEAPLPVTVQLEATAPKAPRSTATAKVTLPPGKTQPLTLNYGYPTDTTHALALTLSGPQPGQVLDYQFCQVPGLIDAQLVRPAFRSALLSTLPGAEVLVRGRLNAPAEWASKLKLQARLVGLGVTSPEFSPEANGHWECTLSATTLLSGTYAVEVTARERGAVVGTLTLPLTKPENKPCEAGYDERLRLWHNGQLKLPVGLFYAVDETDFAAAAEAGFNTLVLPARLAGTRAMEQAAKLGLSVIVSSATMEQDFWKNASEKYNQTPELLGWYPLQKPGSQVPPVHPALMADIYGRLRVLDPRHPVCLALDSLSRLEPYAAWCDVLMPWTEPEPAGDLRSVDAMLQRAVAVVDGRRPLWAVLQITGAAWSQDSRLDPAGIGRPPTPEEYRCMVYLAFARGASGIFDYALRIPQHRDQREYSVQRDAPELWQMIRRVGQELKALTPVLLEGEPLAIEAPDKAVALRGYKYNGVSYILAVNPTPTAVPVAFKVPGLLDSQLEVAFDARKLVGPGGGQFGDQLEPHAVRVYMGK